MTYQQDLARLHKERKARLWPVKANTTPPSRLHTARAELDSIRREIEKARADLEQLQKARVIEFGESRFYDLRDEICRKRGIGVMDFISQSRSHDLTAARGEFAGRARAMGCSYPKIGYYMGGRDHTTVIYHVQRHKAKDAEPMIG